MSARTVRTATAGLLLAAAAVSGSAAIAAADATTDNTAAFLEHIHALGFPSGSDSTLINAGTKLCDAMDSGVSLSMVQAITENTLTPKGYSISDADRFVAYVVADLC